MALGPSLAVAIFLTYLAAGAAGLREAQVLCLVAGANSVFYGDTLLITLNAGIGEDADLFAALDPKASPAPAPAS